MSTEKFSLNSVASAQCAPRHLVRKNVVSFNHGVGTWYLVHAIWIFDKVALGAFRTIHTNSIELFAGC